MPVRYMLDTDTCIHLRSRRLPEVVRRFAMLTPAQAVMSVVSYGELRLGAEKSSRRQQALRVLASLVQGIRVEPLTARAAEEYAAIRSELERRGEIIGANDLWIGAHARALRLTLVTGNEREFRRVPGLSVENWATAT